MRKLIAPLIVLALAVVAASFLAGAFRALGVGSEDVASQALGAITQVAFWLAVAWLAKRTFDLFVRQWLSLRRVDGGAPKLIGDIAGAVLFAGAAMVIALQVFHQPVIGLVATSSVAIGVVGFALRETFNDIFSGIALNVEHPFKIGDWIQFGDGAPDETGRIVEINWRATRLVTIQGRMIVVPNGQLAATRFVNMNAPEQHYRTVKRICVDYSAPPERVVDIFMSAIRATDGVILSQPNIVLIDDCLERGILYGLHFWVDDYPRMFTIERQVVINAINYLNQAGFVPAYPKREMDITWRHPRRISRNLDVLDLLGRVPLFDDLPAKELAQLAVSILPTDYEAGDSVIEEGEEGNSLYLVVAGVLSVSVAVENGAEKEVAKLRPGEFFGEMSLLTGAPRSATVRAESPVTLLEINRRDLEPAFEADPGLVDHMSTVQAERLASREAVLRTTEEEQQEIEANGLVNFIGGRMRQLFGLEGRKVRA